MDTIQKLKRNGRRSLLYVLAIAVTIIGLACNSTQEVVAKQQESAQESPYQEPAAVDERPDPNGVAPKRYKVIGHIGPKKQSSFKKWHEDIARAMAEGCVDQALDGEEKKD